MTTTPRRWNGTTRAGFFRLHSWLGVVTGICMLLIAWSGSVVVFNDEIEWLLNPAVRADPAAPPGSIDDALAAIQGRHPDRRVSLNLQIGPRWAHVGYAYDGPTQWFLQIDPATAAVRTDVPMRGYTFNVAYFLRQLHVRLLMGAWGRIFVGLFGVTLVLSVITSLAIYRQWWRSLFRIRRHDGPRIFQMDLHKAIGAWSLVFSLMFGVTGAILGLENLYNRIWPPARGGPLVSTEPGFTIAPRLTPSGIVAALVSRDPEFVPSAIDVSPDGRVVVRGNHPGAFIAKGASSLTVTSATGEVTSVVDARQLRWPGYLYNLLDPLHFGYFGERWGFVAGYIVEGLWCLIGLAPGGLALTGGVMWLLRQRRRERSTTVAIAPAGSVAATLAYAGAMLPFVAAGYVLQATTWSRGWQLTGAFWEHWIVKPVSLAIVAFPITLAIVWTGRRFVAGASTPRARAVRAALSALPLGALYLAGLSMLN